MHFTEIAFGEPIHHTQSSQRRLKSETSAILFKLSALILSPPLRIDHDQAWGDVEASSSARTATCCVSVGLIVCHRPSSYAVSLLTTLACLFKSGCGDESSAGGLCGMGTPYGDIRAYGS